MPLRPMPTATVALRRASSASLRVTTAARRGTRTSPAREIRSRPPPATKVRLRMPATPEVGIRAPPTPEARVRPRATTRHVRSRAWATSTRVRTKATTRSAPEVIVSDRRAPTRPTPVHRRPTATGPALQTRTRRRRSSVVLRTKSPRCRGPATEVPRRTRIATVFKSVPAATRPTMREVMRLPRRGTPRSNYPVPREIPRPRRGSHRRSTVIHRRPEVAVTRRKVLMIPLHRSSFEVMITLRSQLVRSRTRMEPTRTAVEANPVHSHVVDDRPVVHVRHMNRTEVSTRVVIEERPAPPVTTRESNTGITEAVIDTAVEPDVRPPVPGVP